MPNRDLSAAPAYGPRIYAAEDHTLEIYDPEADRRPSALLLFGVTVLAAALVIAARRSDAPLGIAGQIRPVRQHRGVLPSTDAKLHMIGDALSQAQVVLAGIGQAASALREAVSEAQSAKGKTLA